VGKEVVEDHPRFVVERDRNGYWQVYDHLAQAAIFGCDQRGRCLAYANARNCEVRHVT
jgi:hypothetical protein